MPCTRRELRRRTEGLDRLAEHDATAVPNVETVLNQAKSPALPPAGAWRSVRAES